MALSNQSRKVLQSAFCSYDIADEVADAIDAATPGGSTVTASAAELNIMDGVGADKDELNILEGATVTTAELNQLSGNILSDMTPGTGISTGSGTICEHSVTKIGGIYKTEIFIDLTGLADDDATNDIIGKPDGTANCHLGQITAAVNGTIVGGRITCLEAPTTGDPDIDLYHADGATGAQGASIDTADSGSATILINHGDWSAGDIDELTAMPAADEYLYLAVGAGTPDNGTYDAGKLLIELWGVAAS